MQHVCGGTHRSAVAARIATGSLTSTSSPAASSSRPRHSARAQAAVQARTAGTLPRWLPGTELSCLQAPQIHATAPERETDKYGVERLKLQLKGWDSWCALLLKAASWGALLTHAAPQAVARVQSQLDGSRGHWPGHLARAR